MRKKHFGPEIVKLSVLTKQNLDQITAKYQITSIQSRIMVFIAHESCEREIHQKDIEEEFKIRKSSVSSVMKSMEKNGLIVRVASQDIRCKKIVLSEKGMELHHRIKEEIQSFDNNFRNVLSEAEQKEFLRMVSKLAQYLDNK